MYVHMRRELSVFRGFRSLVFAFGFRDQSRVPSML
jgi:hypothetical protein